MNLDKIKSKVDEISCSTGVKNPKVLIIELCGVIRSLIVEINKIKTSPTMVLPKQQLMDDDEVPGFPITKAGPTYPPIQNYPKQQNKNIGDAE